MYVKYMLYVGQDSFRTPVRTGVLKEFMEAMLYAYNVHVVCRSGLLRNPCLDGSSEGVLSGKEWKLCM